MKYVYLLCSLFCLAGCADVSKVATAVVTDPATVAAANVLVSTATSAAALSNPEIAAMVAAGAALVGAVVAYRKKK
jgi:hypothetical protein